VPCIAEDDKVAVTPGKGLLLSSVIVPLKVPVCWLSPIEAKQKINNSTKKIDLFFNLTSCVDFSLPCFRDRF